MSDTESDYDENYDVAAYRTLTTIVELFAEEKRDVLLQSLLNFEYSKIINWAITYGLSMPVCCDFLFPFKDWLLSKHMVKN